MLFGKIKAVNLLAFLMFKETEDELNTSVTMEDGNSVQKININHKTLQLDPSEKSIKSANPGNEITSQSTTTISPLWLVTIHTVSVGDNQRGRTKVRLTSISLKPLSIVI